MDFKYSCGHTRKGGTGATIHETCPACGKGALLGVRAKVTVSREDLQAMVDAMQAVKPLTGKEQPEHKPVFAHYDCGCVLGTDHGGIVPKICLQCSQGGEFLHTLDTIEGKPLPKQEVEGRPPVNTRCLARCKRQWRTGTVIWHREGNDVDAVVLDDDGHTTFWAWEFRPIRTQEQRDREELISAAIKACPFPGSRYTRIDVEALYDAGMLRPLKTDAEREREEVLRSAEAMDSGLQSTWELLVRLYDAGMLRKAGDQ